MKKIMYLMVFLAIASMSMAVIAPVSSVTVNNVPGTPPQYNLLTITVGTYTIPLSQLCTGTSTGTANQGGATYSNITNMDTFDLNLYAARNAVPAPNNNIDTVLFGGKNYYNTNGSQPDFFLFESASGSNPDDVGVAPIFPDGTVGSPVNLPTAGSGWGATGLLINGGPNEGQTIMGVCFDITDLKDAAGVNLSSGAVIKGIRIVPNPPAGTGGLDPCLFCAVTGSPAVYLEPLNNSIGITAPVTFKWESSYQGDGKVLSYTLNMDDTQANVETPIAGNLIYNQVVTVGGSTPAPYAAQYTYNNALANDQDYFWRVDTVIGDPNYNVPDPNFPLYNLTNTSAGSVWKFTGPVTIPRLTGPSDVTIQPDPLTHVFTNTTAVFTADILCSAAITNVQWFKEGNATPLANGAPYTIAWNQTQTTLTVTGVTTADNGKYYCKVFTASDSTESSHASLYRQYVLKHRYSFTSDCSDSIGGANGTITGTTGLATFADGKLTLGNTGVTSGDPNGILLANSVFVDLPNGIISALGNHATILVWYTVDDTTPTFMRIFEFGTNVKGEGFAGAVNTVPDNASNNYIYMTPKTATNGPVGTTTVNNAGNSQSGTMMPVAGTEYCVAFVWDGNANQLRLYVNGVKNPAGTTALNRKLSELTDINNWLGRSQWKADVMFKGKYNELRIYDIPLTPEWLTEIYTKGPDSLNLDPCILPSVYDANGDCIVEITDLKAFVAEWLSCGLLVCP